MGILNLTPDSFYDGGKYNSDKDLLQKVEIMLKEGANIIDIGAASTRPGASEISEEEEIKRLIPNIKKISKHFPEAIISVDTYRSKIAYEAIENGALMINDISGGTFDENMFKTIADLNVPYILMHIKGTPGNMQNNPEYSNVVEDVLRFFKEQLQKLDAFNVTKNIILDPGFGFGKNLDHNYILLKKLETIKALGFPLLVGVSRKSMINKVLETSPNDALNGTTVLNTIALLNGANILRVHDVNEAVEAVKIYSYYKSV
jgi:dihydropteroate synthase